MVPSAHDSKECCSVLKERRRRNGQDRVLSRNGNSKEGSNFRIASRCR